MEAVTVRVRVVDEKGNPVANARLRVNDTYHKPDARTTSDSTFKIHDEGDGVFLVYQHAYTIRAVGNVGDLVFNRSMGLTPGYYIVADAPLHAEQAASWIQVRNRASAPTGATSALGFTVNLELQIVLTETVPQQKHSPR